MTAITKSFISITDAAVDADSPIDVNLMMGLRDDVQHLREWLGASYYAGAIQDHNHDGLNSATVTASLATHLSNVSAGTNYHAVPGWYIPTMTTTTTFFVEVANCVILRNGTFRVSVASVLVSGSPISHLQIYKNGVAFGTDTAFNNGNVTGTEIYSEDLTFSEGDFVQLFLHNASSTLTASVQKWKLGTSTAGFVSAANASVGDR